MLLKLLLSRSPVNSFLPKTMIKISLIVLSSSVALIRVDAFFPRKHFPYLILGNRSLGFSSTFLSISSLILRWLILLFPLVSLYTQSWGFSLSLRPGFEMHTCSPRLSSSSHHLDDTLTRMARRAFKYTPLEQNRPVGFAILPPSLLLPVWFPSW